MPLTEADVLGALDAGCRGEEAWPVFVTLHPDRAYHALRLVASRHPARDDWFVVFECVEGSSVESFCVKRYVHCPLGSFLLDRSGLPSLFVEGPWRASGENVLVGPHGPLSVTADELRLLAPQQSTARHVRDMRFTLLVRAYLRSHPQAFWSEETGLWGALEREGFGITDHELILESLAFEHVVGQASDAFDLEGVDGRWRKMPSQSPVYQSLARVLVTRTRDFFWSGTSNLDWRLHLDSPQAERFA